MKQEDRDAVYRRAVGLFSDTPPKYAKEAYDAIHRAHLTWHTCRNTIFICNTVRDELDTCVTDSVLYIAVELYVQYCVKTKRLSDGLADSIRQYGLPSYLFAGSPTEWYYSRLALWEIILIITDALIHEQTEKYYV